MRSLPLVLLWWVAASEKAAFDPERFEWIAISLGGLYALVAFAMLWNAARPGFWAALAVGILWVGKLTIIDPLSENFVLIDNFSTIGFVPLVVTLMGAAVVVSALGSGVTLRRFLRV